MSDRELSRTGPKDSVGFVEYPSDGFLYEFLGTQMTAERDHLAIDLRYVAKTYRRRIHALRGIEMRVYPGEIFGLLGPNGAGKSTLVKIIMTVVRPNRAEGTILGRPMGHKPTLAQVGYLPENHRFPAYLTGRQALEYYAALAKVGRRERKRRAMELLELVGMHQWANTKLGTYSKGMQQRIGLAQALSNDPQLVVLDEPTDGLDPVGRRETREILLRLRDQGKTVFLNSHLLGEVERVCSRVAILVAGKVVRQGTLDELTAASEHYEIGLHGDATEGLSSAVRAALPCELQAAPVGASPFGAAAAPPGVVVPVVVPTERGTLPSGETVEFDGAMVRIHTDQAQAVQPVIDALRGQGLVIESVRLVRQSLEDFFIQAVSDTQNGDAAVQAIRKGGPA
ncbi:MAG: hypothetical protein A2V70_10875 [Planctomycetes bacterium RBG_13_63_9]|nr:MAG: hypothetical protein A2V70_10875 [Planctomycetes bacterium RBG_13_63_9]